MRDSLAAIDTHLAQRGPLLPISGSDDHTVPRSVTQAVHKLCAGSPSTTDYQEFEGRGHSLTIDSGWKEVADAVLGWLDQVAVGRQASTA